MQPLHQYVKFKFRENKLNVAIEIVIWSIAIIFL